MSKEKYVGIVRTIGGYPDNSEHTVELICRHGDLRDGDLLYTAPPKREPLSEDAVDECLANAIKNGWYPVNEDSYRQGFWDAVKFLEVGNE